MESQFWGVVLQPEKMYEQTVESSFHVSMATIEASSMGNKATSVFVEAGSDEFLICNLNNSNLNVHLDLNFIEGEKIGFRSTGPGTIHLTGYLIPDDNMMGEFEDSEDSEEDEVPALVNGNKRKAAQGGDSAPSKKTKKELALARANKVLEEYAAKKNAKEEDDEDTSDDGILDFTENYAEEEDSDDSDDEAEDSDDDDDEDEYVEMEASPAKKTPEKKKQQVQTPTTPITPKSNSKKNNKGEGPDSASKKKDVPKSPKSFFKGGVQCEDLKVGSGPEVRKGKMIGMYYDGRIKSNNKRFDATLTGKPFKFRLGAGEVIKGWDLGLEGMKVGGKRRLTIPPQFAYGKRGAAPDIPPSAALVFEVECKFVK